MITAASLSYTLTEGAQLTWPGACVQSGDAMKAGIPYKRFQRRRKVNWYGSTAFFLYIVAFFFYMYIRITKTMDLGGYIAYVPQFALACRHRLASA